jgi:hypothetical protein
MRAVTSAAQLANFEQQHQSSHGHTNTSVTDGGENSSTSQYVGGGTSESKNDAQS